MLPGIILQARTGSTRLPGKILKPFFEKDTILDIIIKQFKDNKYGFPVILATSNNEKDGILEEVASKHSIIFFRGSEQNVLERFIEAGEKNKLSAIVRVCADNPFLSLEGFNVLIEEWKREPSIDYLSFKSHEGKPSIKTHWGLFTEIVSLKALKKVAALTEASLYQEHVTNYIYEHPQHFNIKLLDAPKEVFTRNDLRFTIDTQEDFDILKKLYSDFLNSYSIFALPNLIEFVNQQPQILEQMKRNIKENTK